MESCLIPMWSYTFYQTAQKTASEKLMSSKMTAIPSMMSALSILSHPMSSHNAPWKLVSSTRRDFFSCNDHQRWVRWGKYFATFCFFIQNMKHMCISLKTLGSQFSLVIYLYIFSMFYSCLYAVEKLI